MRRTKIICTIGPSCNTKEHIYKLVENGMNVARLNFSHGSHEQHKAVIDIIKEVRTDLKIPLAILLDTKGPEMRVGMIEDLEVHRGKRYRLVKEKKEEGDIPIHPAFIVDQIDIGGRILFDDGYIEGMILRKGDGFAEIEIKNDGVIKKRKGINVPGQLFDLPDLAPQDMEDIKFGCREGIEIIAASFINSAKQVLLIKELLESEGRPDILVFSKIENQMGVANFDEILQVSDGIMVARGDLGVELFPHYVPPIQKQMIKECNLKSKPVIIATQMLESMIKNPMPTRAEVSDVANAIYDAASCVMLSGETAVGAYPFQAVAMMHNIICEAEKDFDYSLFFQNQRQYELYDVPSAMARAAVNTCYSVGASAIIVCSNSGQTVRRICRFRPKALIIVVTPSMVTFHQTAIHWGTVAYLEKNDNIDKGFKELSCYALYQKWVKYGDLVVMTSGKPYRVSFTTNTLMVETIGDLIVRGEKMPIEGLVPVSGEVVFFIKEMSEGRNDFKGKVVVTTKIKREDLSLLSEAAAIILQNNAHDKSSKELLSSFYEEKKIPYITRADAASSLLKEKDFVRIYPSLGIVCKGDSMTEEEMLAFCEG